MKKPLKKSRSSHAKAQAVGHGKTQPTFQCTSIAPMVAAPDGSVFMNVELCRGAVPTGRDVFIGIQLTEAEKRASQRQLENSLFEAGVMIIKKLGGE